MKKLTAFVLAGSLIVSTPTFIHAEDDITGHYFEKEIRVLDQMGIMNGYEEGVYKPNNLVTRAEFAAFIARSLNLPAGNSSFTDVREDYVLFNDISRAASANIVGGTGDGKFSPNREITREEMVIMIDRALQLKKVIGGQPELTFSDKEKINYPIHIQHAVSLGIIGGYDDGKFHPNDYTTRAQAAAVIHRMLNAIAKHQPKPKPKPKEEQVQSTHDLAIANQLVVLYKEDMETSLTYVASGTEMKLLEEEEDRAKVQLYKTIGYVHKNQIEIKDLDEARAYYEIKDSELMHHVYINDQFESYIFGPKPSFMDEGETSYSWDGITYEDGKGYHYFSYLPLHTKTTYDAEDLDNYVKAIRPDSPLVGLGEVFKEAEEEYSVNALYLLSQAIHESAWGLSDIAQAKHNLFGIRAEDGDAANKATSFNSFEHSIMFAADYIADKYLDPEPPTFYKGAFVGNKSVGINVMYASDPHWGQKVAGRMYQIDKFLGGKEWGKYELAVSNVESLNVRKEPNKKSELLYEYKQRGMTMIVVEKVVKNDETWFKIISDNPDYEYAYVYADGELGNFVKTVPLLK